jgi:hypothetical protein
VQLKNKKKMKRSEIKTFVPRSGNVSDSNEQVADIDLKKSKESESSRLIFWKGIWKGFLGLVIGIIFFIAAYQLIPEYLHVGYVALSILSLLVAAGILKALDYGLGEKQTVLSGPITIALFVIFILSLYYGSEHSTMENIDQTEQTSSEFGTVSSVGEIWRTTKSYKAGTNVKLRIRGSSVRILKGEKLTPCDYNLPILTDGTIAFQGINDTPSEIEVVQVE